MRQVQCILKFIACICRQDRDGLGKIISRTTQFASNGRKLAGTEATDRIMDQVVRYVSDAERYDICPGEYSDTMLADGLGYVSFPFRLVMFRDRKSCEECILLNAFFNRSEMMLLQMVRQDSFYRRHCIELRGETVVRPENEIRFLESDNNHVLWNCRDAIFKERAKISERSKMLSNRFINVRNSHWVNMDYITDFRRCEMTVYPNTKIAIPKARYSYVKDVIIQRNRKQRQC